MIKKNNFRVSIVVIQSKKQGKRKTENNDYWKKQLRAVISIATVTGISWIIAPFVILQHGKNNSYSLVMQWIFNISMGLQVNKLSVSELHMPLFF